MNHAEIDHSSHEMGGSASAYAKPTALDPYYGSSPFGYTLFARLSLGH